MGSSFSGGFFVRFLRISLFSWRSGLSLIEMPFRVIQFIKKTLCKVVCRHPEFEVTLCELSGSLCVPIKACPLINSNSAPETAYVSSATMARLWARLRSLSGPVLNSGCLSSTNFTLTLKNSTNTHLVFGLSMMWRIFPAILFLLRSPLFPSPPKKRKGFISTLRRPKRFRQPLFHSFVNRLV